MQLDLTPSAHWQEHQLTMEPSEDQGPVVVVVEYHVPQDQVDAFVEVIAKLRVIRLRDGAYFWSLNEDLQSPGQFQEIFHVGSWAEHQRQHARATEEDKQVELAIHALSEGREPKVLHYLMRDVRRVRAKKSD